MATKLQQFSDTARSERSSYDWDEWFDGDVWAIEKGVDFNTTCEAMRSYIITKAKEYGGKVKTHVRPDKDIIEFQFYIAEDPTDVIDEEDPTDA